MYLTRSQIFAVLTVSTINVATSLISTQNSSSESTLDDYDETLLRVVLLIAVIVGCISGGVLLELLGRKTTLLATFLPLVVSWLLIAIENHDLLVHSALTILECCKAVVELSILVYTVEILQSDIRGGLTLLPKAIACLAYLIFLIFTSVLPVGNLAFFISFALLVPFLIFMCLIPESPRWYVSRGKIEKARNALQWLRGPTANVSFELNEIKITADMRHTILTTEYIRPVLICLGLLFFHQFSGLQVVLFYNNSEFHNFVSSLIDSEMTITILTAVTFVTYLLAMLLVDRVGRKILLLISQGVMTLSLVAIGLFFYIRESHDESVGGLEWIAIFSVVLYVVAFYLGCGSVLWLVIGEICPGRIRGPAVAAFVAISHMLNIPGSYVVLKSIHYMVPQTIMFSYAAICFVGLVFVLFLVPETKEESLEDIERYVI